MKTCHRLQYCKHNKMLRCNISIFSSLHLPDCLTCITAQVPLLWIRTKQYRLSAGIHLEIPNYASYYYGFGEHFTFFQGTAGQFEMFPVFIYLVGILFVLKGNPIVVLQDVITGQTITKCIPFHPRMNRMCALDSKAIHTIAAMPHIGPKMSV